VEQIFHKISPSSGPWSKIFLEKAEQAKHAEVLEAPSKRRSKRVLSIKKGFKDPQCSSKTVWAAQFSPPTYPLP